MTSYSRQANLVGLLITLAALIVQWQGWFEPLERDSLDFRASYTWLTPRPMTDEIRIVAIDDGALDSVGRWPWPRSKLASAITELRRAGAKTIALDLLLTEPETDPNRPVWVPIDSAEIRLRQIPETDLRCEGEGEDETCLVQSDQDLALARAMGEEGSDRGRCVLAIYPPDDPKFGEVWSGPIGTGQYRRMIEELAGNIQLKPEEVAEKAALTHEQRERLLNHEMTIKSIAAMEALDLIPRTTGVRLTREEFVERMAPRLSEHVRWFPELDMLRRTWERYEAWRKVRPLLLLGGGPIGSRDQPPIPILAGRAAGVGFAARQEDPDGEIRELMPALDVPTGRAMQFGLAAAMTHLGLSPSQVELDSTTLSIGGRSFPLHDGRLWLAWPRPLDHSAGHGEILRQTLEQSESHGIISLAAAVSLAEQRERLERNKQVIIDQFTSIFPGTKLGGDTIDAKISDVKSQIEFDLASYAGDQGLTDEEREQFAPRLELRDKLKLVDDGQTDLGEAGRTLQGWVQDKLVFVGWTATGAAADTVPTPLDTSTPGVMVHAVVADMVLTGRKVRFAPLWTTYGLIALLGLCSTLAASKLEPGRSTAAAAMMLLVYFILVAYVAFGGMGLAFAMIGPMVTGGAAWLFCTALEAMLFQRDRLRITRQFKARVSSQLVDYLVDNPGAVSMSGEQREMTIMFSDLAGFTALSESLGGPATVATLNRYLGAMTEVLIKEGAYLNKFLGDGFVAFWSAFAIDPDQATRACRAALQCQRSVRELNEKPVYETLPRLSLRVGITTGRVIVGDCGAPPQLNDYTVIGDAVNLASRLESANKQFGTRILIDGRTRELLEADDLLLRPIGRVAVVGQKHAVDVYEVLPEDYSGEIIHLTARAVDAFTSGDLKESSVAWKMLIERTGPSVLAATYLEAIAEAEGEAEFDGVLRLREK